MDIDTLIRERSGAKHSLDDFARSFFGIDDGSVVAQTYTFDDIVRALNAVQPYDWASFLRQRLDATDSQSALDGLRRGGYRLVFTETQGDYERSAAEGRRRVDLLYSLGLYVGDGDATGGITEVLWNSPAFNAGLTNGDHIIAVNGLGYSGALLEEAVRATRTSSSAIQLIVKSGDYYRVVSIDYHGGLRYPHLERYPSQPARLDDILAARP